MKRFTAEARASVHPMYQNCREQDHDEPIMQETRPFTKQNRGRMNIVESCGNENFRILCGFVWCLQCACCFPPMIPMNDVSVIACFMHCAGWHPGTKEFAGAPTVLVRI